MWGIARHSLKWNVNDCRRVVTKSVAREYIWMKVQFGISELVNTYHVKDITNSALAESIHLQINTGNFNLKLLPKVNVFRPKQYVHCLQISLSKILNSVKIVAPQFIFTMQCVKRIMGLSFIYLCCHIWVELDKAAQKVRKL